MKPELFHPDPFPTFPTVYFKPEKNCQVPSNTRLTYTSKTENFGKRPCRYPYIPGTVHFDCQRICIIVHLGCKTLSIPEHPKANHVHSRTFWVPYISIAEHFDCRTLQNLTILKVEHFCFRILRSITVQLSNYVLKIDC